MNSGTKIKTFLKRKNIEISLQRYLVDIKQGRSGAAKKMGFLTNI